jgi:hypothetical protein
VTFSSKIQSLGWIESSSADFPQPAILLNIQPTDGFAHEDIVGPFSIPQLFQLTKNPSGQRMHRFYSSLVMLALSVSPAAGAAQATAPSAAAATDKASLPDAPDSNQATPGSQPSQSSSQAQLPGQDRNPPPPVRTLEGKQTKRILGIIPNFRSVSVDEKLPPISKHDKFKLMLDDNFDYSNFLYVAILSGIGQAENSIPEFHHGVPAYARYYWHSYADTFDANLMTEFLIPVATREDPRYYTLGRGGFVKRTVYSFSRLAITRSDTGGKTPNVSEIVGNGAAAGISSLYYPSPERTWTKTGQRWVTQIALDGFANIIKEFWPDINSKIFRSHY